MTTDEIKLKCSNMSPVYMFKHTFKTLPMLQCVLYVCDTKVVDYLLDII
jgi:hypothetical protein